jgi:hypothetical protein
MTTVILLGAPASGGPGYSYVEVRRWTEVTDLRVGSTEGRKSFYFKAKGKDVEIYPGALAVVVEKD